MRLVFNASYCIPIHSRSLEERPLGGTETGVIRVASVLAGLGHEVTVITSMSEVPSDAGVGPRYVSSRDIATVTECDVLIAVQDWRTAIVPIRTPRRVFWTGDGPDQFINYGLGDKRVVRMFDGIFAVSNWQALSLTSESGFPLAKSAVVFNGVHLPWFDGSEVRNRKRLIYASAPYRGLELVPKILPLILSIDPTVELHVFSALSIYGRAGAFEGPEQASFEALSRELEKIPNCFLHGNIPQRDLAREYMRSALLFYPNVFRETSCIVALEAMAAGCPVVTSHFGALPETVGRGGITIRGNPYSPDYYREFAAATVKILADDTTWKTLSESGLKRIKELHTWEQVGERFNAALERVSR